MSNQGLEIEEKVKQILQKEFGRLTKKKLPVGTNRKEFDLVTDDGQVIIEVKSYKFDNHTTGKSGYTSTRKQRLITASAYLDKVEGKRKILVLTNKKLYEQFKSDMAGDGLFPVVELMHVPVDDLRISSCAKVEQEENRVSNSLRSKRYPNGSWIVDMASIKLEQCNELIFNLKNYDESEFYRVKLPTQLIKELICDGRLFKNNKKDNVRLNFTDRASTLYLKDANITRYIQG